MADAAGTPPRDLQQFLGLYRWDESAMRDQLQQRVARRHGHRQSVGIIDETSFVKKGEASVGVQRQYCGRLGKLENCQVGVFLTYVGSQGHAFLDRRLYLPQGWVDDAERRAEAAVPEAVTFQTKPALAWAMRRWSGSMSTASTGWSGASAIRSPPMPQHRSATRPAWA